MSTEIITAQQYNAAQLREHAETINQSIDLVIQHEEAFRESTLEPCLLIGREIAKAQAIFGLGDHDKMAVARDGKSLLSRGVTTESQPPNPLGFSAWLAREIPRLNRTTAHKYSSCFKALELSEDATESHVRSKIKDLRHAAGKAGKPMPSLNSLYKSTRPTKSSGGNLPAPQETVPGKSGRQVRLEDARENFTLWREEGEKLIQSGHLDWLDKKGLEELKEFQGWLRDRVNAALKSL